MNTLVYRKTFLIIVFLAVWLRPWYAIADTDKLPVFVGSEACAACHVDEYRNFTTYSKKSRSFQSIKRLEKGLTNDEIKKCYACHTTGYGKPGGFISPESTPKLMNAGCEVCHGPGSRHVATAKADHIKRHMNIADCETCHIAERVTAFRFKPLIHGGGH